MRPRKRNDGGSENSESSCHSVAEPDSKGGSGCAISGCCSGNGDDDRWHFSSPRKAAEMAGERVLRVFTQHRDVAPNEKFRTSAKSGFCHPYSFCAGKDPRSTPGCQLALLPIRIVPYEFGQPYC